MDHARRRRPDRRHPPLGPGRSFSPGCSLPAASAAASRADRFLFVGAGAAALGIAGMLRRELEAEGIDPTIAASSIAMLDHLGLVHLEWANLHDDQRPCAVDPRASFAARLDEAELADPAAIARAMGTTVLIGATACGGAFSEALVREVGRNDPVPIVLPLSNPGSCAEARPEDILAWTDGRAFVAAGSPSRDVDAPTGRRVIGQANNVFVFPRVGLGAIVAEMREITDDVFLVAARELSRLVSADRLRAGSLYPPIDQLRAVARAIAIAVVRHARNSGDGRSCMDEEIEPAVDRAMWWPAYLPYEAAG
jgi:malic enzyme